MNAPRAAWLVPAVLAILTGCGPSRETARMLDELTHGETTKAEATALDLYGDDADEALVRRMELGAIRQAGGDLTGSLAELDAAAPLVDERRTTSLTDTALTAVVNDAVGAYAGRAFEHTQVDALRVVNHLLLAQAADSTWQPPRLWWPQGPIPTLTPPLSADQHRQRAITFARRMTINQLKETEDANEGRRYDDDPFARVLAACTVETLPPAERTEGDQQFAVAMLMRALHAYGRQHRELSAASGFRYEVSAEPPLVRLLHLRHLLAYDPEEAQRQLEARGLQASAVRRPPGQGSLLVLHGAGLITRPEPLQIGLGAVGFAPPSGSDAFTWGAVTFVATGPGSSRCRQWPVLPIPGEVVQRLLAPGGAAVIGFELPTHRDDARPPAPAQVQVVGGPSQVTEVIGDLDAYARATLADDQPRQLVRTLLRVVAKQSAVAVASAAVRNGNSEAAGLLAFLVNLIGSAAATATESADLRAWNTLPDRFEAALLDLPPGSHRVTVTTALGPCDLGDVRIHPDRLTIAVLRSPDTLAPQGTP